MAMTEIEPSRVRMGCPPLSCLNVRCFATIVHEKFHFPDLNEACCALDPILIILSGVHRNTQESTLLECDSI